MATEIKTRVHRADGVVRLWEAYTHGRSKRSLVLFRGDDIVARRTLPRWCSAAFERRFKAEGDAVLAHYNDALLATLSPAETTEIDRSFARIRYGEYGGSTPHDLTVVRRHMPDAFSLVESAWRVAVSSPALVVDVRGGRLAWPVTRHDFALAVEFQAMLDALAAKYFDGDLPETAPRGAARAYAIQLWTGTYGGASALLPIDDLRRYNLYVSPAPRRWNFRTEHRRTPRARHYRVDVSDQQHVYTWEFAVHNGQPTDVDQPAPGYYNLADLPFEHAVTFQRMFDWLKAKRPDLF